MTLTRFVTKNAFRNKRRSILTVLSIGGSLLLLTFLITIWRSFYDSKPSEQSAQRLIVRHKVSLVFNLPSYYKQKIQAIPGVKEVVNQQWFGGQYKDDKPEQLLRPVRHRSARDHEGVSGIQDPRRPARSLAA